MVYSSLPFRVDKPVPPEPAPEDEPIAPEGPAAYFSTLPVKAMVAAIREAGIPSSLSNSAGVYVCNHLMYGVLHAAATRFPGMRAGFIHVPFIPEQVARKGGNLPSMALETIAKALEAAIYAVRDHGADIAAVVECRVVEEVPF